MSSASVSTTQYHLTSQYYDICIRRARTSCSICYSPQIFSNTPGTASSYGLSAGSDAATQTNAIGSSCTGVTVLNAIAASNLGFGDYLDIVALQPSIGTTGTLGSNRICGSIFNAQAAPQTGHATACSWAVPFKVGVHFDADDAIGVFAPTAPPGAPGAPAAPTPSTELAALENDAAATSGAGYGYSGFYLAYWQNSC